MYLLYYMYTAVMCFPIYEKRVTCLSIVCEDGAKAADLFYRIHSMMMYLGIPMWIEQTTIQFTPRGVETLIAVMSYLNAYWRITDQQHYVWEGVLYSTITWDVPVTI